jgi:uncharacterized membrane protein
MDREMLKCNAKEQLRGNWGLAVRTLFILTVLESIISLLNLLEKVHLAKFDSSISDWIFVIVLIFEGVFNLGVCKFTLNLATNKEEAKFNDAFSGFDVFLKTLGLNVLISLCTIIGFLLFVVPGIIILSMFSQVFYILNEDKSKGIIECLGESARMMKGHKWEYIVLMFSFIGWDILTIITFYIGDLWLNPYKQATYTNYYLELKKENK